MNRSHRLSTCLITSLSLLALCPLPAQNPAPPTQAPESAPPPNTIAFAGKITALQPEAHTLTVDDPAQGPRTVHIGEQTLLKKGARAATWPELKIGQTVEGIGSRHGAMFHADSLQIHE